MCCLFIVGFVFFFFFFKQKTAYEMRISDWSSDVCSSDLITGNPAIRRVAGIRLGRCDPIVPNDPEFGSNEAEIAAEWCARSGIPYLGRADIGHDVGNKVVPFGSVPFWA